MHKKHNKPHRHRDVSHKRSSKTKNHHKHHKKDHPVSQSLLEPILEVSKEKVKIDKNACGDYVQSSLLPQSEDVVKNTSKHRRKKNRKNKVEKPAELCETNLCYSIKPGPCRKTPEYARFVPKHVEEIDIFAKNYIQKIKKSSEQQVVRHHSLEKSGESLIEKTKNLFRKEKSFNDAVQKVSVVVNVETQKEEKKESRKHRSRKDDKEQVKESNKRKEKRKHHDKEIKHEENHSKEDKTEHKKKKRKKSKNKSDKPPTEEKIICNRVQEVIYCHLDQIPYKMKNDKSATEVKDLYQRIKKEKRRHKDGKDRSRSHGDEKMRYHLEKDRSHQSHHSPVVARMSTEEKVRKERSRSRPKREQEEITAKEERRTEKREKRDHSSRDRYRHYDLEGIFEHSPRKCKSGTVSKRKHKKESLTNIDLGPYDKYFVYENKKSEEICSKKHRNREEHRRSSRDKKHRIDQDEVAGGQCKKHHKRNHFETGPSKKNTMEADEEKIHQIVEGDLKNYFAKIQHMIDVKLDALVKPMKSNHEKTGSENTNEEEPKKRSKSKTHEKECEKKERGDCKKDNKCEKVDKTKPDKNEKIRKEEIIEEVLKRIKNEEEQKRMKESAKQSGDKENKSKVNEDKEVKVKHASRKEDDLLRNSDNTNAKEHRHSKQSTSKKVPDTVLQERSSSKDNYKSNDRSRKSSSKRTHGDSKSHKQARLESKDHSSNVHSFDKENHKHRHQECHGKKKTFNDDQISLRRSRSPVHIPSSRRSTGRKQRSTESKLLPKDSLTHHKRHYCPHPEKIEPPSGISIFDWEEYIRTKRRFRSPHTHVFPRKDESSSYHSLRKHYTSASSCRAYSEHRVVSSGVTQETTERVVSKCEYKQTVSDQMYKESYNLDNRKISSPDRCSRPLEDIIRVHNYQNSREQLSRDRMRMRSQEMYPQREDVVPPHPEDFLVARQYYEMPNGLPEDHHTLEKSNYHGLVKRNPQNDMVALADRIRVHNHQKSNEHRAGDRMPLRSQEMYPQKEDVVVPHTEDFNVAHQGFEITNILPEDQYSHEQSINHGLIKNVSKHDVITQSSYLGPIFLPPEMFRNPPISDLRENPRDPEKQYPKQDFLVQGIEPPISDPPRKTSKIQVRQRNLECKTVSIIGILPRKTKIDNTPVIDENQSSCSSQKSTSPDGNLVEKRKQSKRFKLYYRYSLIDNNKEDKDSGTSDAKSIISDSYRVLSEPSEDEKAAVQSHLDVKDKERQITSEVMQSTSLSPKKWSRVATPRDSHLNNIIEEPSNMSNSLKNDDYFIPIRAGKECYFRSLTSSHSEYCFRINKKPAISNISIQSKDTCEGRYRFFEDGRCRYCKHTIHSKSDFKIASNGNQMDIPRSKSEVFLGDTSGKEEITSIISQDTQSFAKPRDLNLSPKLNNVKKDKHIVVCTSTECQTSGPTICEVTVEEEEEKSKLAFEDKQKQFKNIYKTIDDLEENIHSSRKAPPKTLDVAISTKFMSLDNMSDKKPQFKAIYKTIDNLEDKMIHTSTAALVKTVNTACGTPTRSRRNSRSESRKSTHEVAVEVNEKPVVRRWIPPGYRSQSRGKKLKSTAVSPIRIIEDVQVSPRSPTRKINTPLSPSTRPNVMRPPLTRILKNKPDESPLRKTAPRFVEPKKDVPIVTYKKPKVSPVKEPPKAKSPERGVPEYKNQKITKPLSTPQPVPAVRVLRSVSARKRENVQYNTGESSFKFQKPINNIVRSTIYENKEELKETGFFSNRSEDTRPVLIVPRIRDMSKENTVTLRKPSCHNHMEEMHKSCVHNYHPRDLSTGQLAVSARNIPVNVTEKPLTVNAALCKVNPPSQNIYIRTESSTSSSVGDSSGENIRRSKSLVELRSRHPAVTRSKSEVETVENVLVPCKPRGLLTKGESSKVNMEKYTNVPRIRCPNSKSDVRSLDQYLRHKFTSRLLLTKDYKGSEISSYQRRKLYDQSIRQRMKKKYKYSKLDVGPQIFEVRFLSMVNPELQREQRECKLRNYFERPLISLSLGKFKKENAFCPIERPSHSMVDPAVEEKRIKIEKTVPQNNQVSENKEDPTITTENLEIADKVKLAGDISIKDRGDGSKQSHIDLLKLLNSDNDKTVTQLYFKSENAPQEKLLSFCNKLLDVNSTLEIQDEFKGAQCNCSKYSEDCQSCKNFVRMMDLFCSSLASYCDSKTNIIDSKKNSESKTDYTCNNKVADYGSEVCENAVDEVVSDNLHVYFPNLETQDTSDNVEEIFAHGSNNSQHNSNESTNPSDKMFRDLVECESYSTISKVEERTSLFQPMSCPTLATTTPSFEYLYEETSSENERISQELVFANLTRPFDQTFNFSTSQYNVQTPFIKRAGYFSGTGSTESGYASIKSKSCKENSFTSFFKKPNIAALFKPPNLAKLNNSLSKISEHRGQGDFEKSALYKEMTKSCQLYARKVRQSSEMKLAAQIDEYQEFSLAILLGKNSSLVLESKIFNQSSTNIAADTNKVTELNSEELNPLEFEENEEDLHADDSNEDFSKLSEISFTENGCRLVLSNECLKIDSVTYLGADIFNEEHVRVTGVCSREREINAVYATSQSNEQNTPSEEEEDSTLTLDFSLDSNNPFVPSKESLARKFFGSLLKVYEKETELCNELFKNDEFLNNVLMPAIKERKDEDKRNKKRSFRRFFKRRVTGAQIKNEENPDVLRSNSQIEAQAKLRNLASEAKKCFTMLAEAVRVNENIDDEIKICGLLKILERIERGDFCMVQNEDDTNFENDVKTQVKEAFINVYEISEKEAKKAKRHIGDQEINLIKDFVSKYRVGLLSKTDIVACYIGRGIIQTEVQLKAAVTYLMSTESNEVNVKNFEEHCNLSKSLEK